MDYDSPIDTAIRPADLYPVLPLRDIVIFPHMVVPLFVGREKSVRALDYAIKNHRQIVLVTQQDASLEDPHPEAIFEVGVLATILQVLKLPDGTIKVLVEALRRVQLGQIVTHHQCLQAVVTPLNSEMGSPVETEALLRTILQQFDHYVKLNKKINPEVVGVVTQITEPDKLADVISSHLAIKIRDKQQILETIELTKRLELVLKFLEGEIGVMNTERKIRTRVKKQMEKTQKEYYLNEQLKAIQKELGEGDDGKNELEQLEERIHKTKLSKEAKEKAISELKKLKQINAMSAEATVVRNYLDWLLSLPWGKESKVSIDLAKAEKVLNGDHYAIEKVKERILEYLAVQHRTRELRGPILCLVGPPGVGKTSLAKSIAEATGRNYVRFSLGGVRDESEIRGHRRTYIGSMPGKIIQQMKKAKTSNPLFLLDEIDKMGVDFRGDPASALLEVLDPEQNANFGDHYLEVDYDLSKVMFVATANTTNLPRPLLDRMEVIRIPGYTEDEKVEIARLHLLPKMLKQHGLRASEWSITDEALFTLIRNYTREAGVRNLERELANLTRKAIKAILMEGSKRIAVTAKNLKKYAGVPRFSNNTAEQEDLVGITNGLAYTEVGGELLSIEALCLPGKGNIKATGKLGEVMQESAQAAYSYIRSRSLDFGITPPQYQKRDIHLHVPEGATPKDGPSAGVAMCVSIVSALTGVPVKRTVAMTGEVTLRGRILAIGGLKEKLLAALRGGIETVFIPSENTKDLAEIPDNVKAGLRIVPVATVDELLPQALVAPLFRVEWQEPSDPVPVILDDKNDTGVIKH
jgi:ATP-dependent Lon protease